MRRCKICVSPYRGEIESLVKQGIPVSEVTRKFHLLLGLKEKNMYIKIGRHLKRKHPPMLESLEPIKPEEVENGVVDVSFKDYSKKLLTTVMNNPAMFDPKKLSHNQVIASQRAIIEGEKAKTQENALKFAMVKFMRGEADGSKLIEGDTE